MADTLYIFLWVFILALGAASIFFSVHLLVNIIDLANDFINPVDMCKAVNRFLIPEYVTQTALVTLMLIGGYFFEFVLTVPIIAINWKKFFDNKHRMEPCSIYDHVEKYKKKTLVVLAFQIISFFWYLYRFVYGLVRGF